MSIKHSEYNSLYPFKAWVQQTLPAIYDDSLSYTDLLAKMLAYMNGLIENDNNLTSDMKNAYDYINNYFDNLDVQDEIDKKLDEMVEDGTLYQYLGNLLPYVTPEMFGAIGDGLTDDTVALQKAIDYVTTNQNLNLVLTKKYLITNIQITNYCHIDFNNRPLIATKNQTGTLLNINIPFVAEDKTLLHDMFKNLLIDGNESYTYDWLFTVSCRSLHLNSVKITNARSNAMQTSTYDGMTFDFIRIIGVNYMDNKIGLHINREDCHFNYIDINDFNICLKITPNVSVHINNAHLWSGGGTGVVFDKGPGANIDSLTLDSMDYGINFNSSNLGFSCFIGNLFFWNINKKCFVCDNNLLFNNVCVGNIQLVGVDNTKIIKDGLLFNFPIRILNGFNYNYGALYTYVKDTQLVKESVRHYFSGNTATSSFLISNVTPINRYVIGKCSIMARQINGKKYGTFKFIANDESEYYYGDVLSDGNNLYCDFYINTPSKIGSVDIKLRYDLETYFE